MNPANEDYVEAPLVVPVTFYGGVEASMADLPEAEPVVPIAHVRTHGPAAMRNLYAAAISYDGFIITDGALRLIVLLHATALGFNAIEIAFMFSMYEVAGVFTNLFGGVAGSKFGLKCTLLSSLVLQLGCLSALTQLEPVVGKIEGATPGSPTFLKAILYITLWQALGGVAKSLDSAGYRVVGMKLTGKATPKLVTREGAEGRLFKTVAWITGMKNAFKGFGSYLGALLVAQFGWVNSLWLLATFLFQFFPLGLFGMDWSLGVSQSDEIDWKGVFRKGHNVNVLSAARFFLFGARDVWFEIGLPMFLQLELGWSFELVGFVLAVYIVMYGYLQAATTNLYKRNDGTTAQPTARAAFEWAAYCSLTPVLTAIGVYISHELLENDIATVVILVVGLLAFALTFAINSAIHSYLIVSYSNKDKVAMDVGFYYMANAGGRLVGVLLGGFLYYYTYEDFGISMCLLVAGPFLVMAALIARKLQDPIIIEV